MSADTLRGRAASMFCRAAYIEVRARVLLTRKSDADRAQGVGLTLAAGRLVAYARSLVRPVLLGAS